jgi:murein DD-endopeptidase MepM/ murein hydrolase activator NlpD
MKPGFYSMVISLEYEDGRKSLVKKDIEIYTRDFPVKKMQIKEEYVTPPAEALKRIEQEAQLLREIYSRPAPVWLARGKFIAPHPGRTAANFGEIRIYNNIRQSTHSGLDVDAETGSLVLASNSGNVALARELYYAGNAVIIDHGLGLFTFYCHFSRLKVKAGDFVEKGDPIGEVGATGRVTGPHLHWGVRVLGSRVDPDSLLSLPLEKL